MNKIGFNLLPWTASVSTDMFPILDRLKKIGYDGIEILIGDPDEAAYRDLATYASKLGLEINGVFVLGEHENPISANPDVRQAGLIKIKWAIDRAKDMNARVLCGPFHSAHGVFTNQPPNTEEYHRAADVLSEVGVYAQQANVVLALEAVNRFETYLCNTMSQLHDLVELVDHPHVRAMYDTHHANIEEKTIFDPIEKIAPYLSHVHISENDRGTPGKGLVHWSAVFECLKRVNYSGWYTIESFSRADPDFANAINVWREYSDPWEIAEEGFKFIKSNINQNY